MEYHIWLAEVIFLKGNNSLAGHWAKEGMAIARQLSKRMHVYTRILFNSVMGRVLNAEGKYREADDLYGKTLDPDLNFDPNFEGGL